MKLSEWTRQFAHETRAAIIAAVTPLAGAINDAFAEAKVARATAETVAGLLAEFEKVWQQAQTRRDAELVEMEARLWSKFEANLNGSAVGFAAALREKVGTVDAKLDALASGAVRETQAALVALASETAAKIAALETARAGDVKAIATSGTAIATLRDDARLDTENVQAGLNSLRNVVITYIEVADKRAKEMADDAAALRGALVDGLAAGAEDVADALAPLEPLAVRVGALEGATSALGTGLKTTQAGLIESLVGVEASAVAAARGAASDAAAEYGVRAAAREAEMRSGLADRFADLQRAVIEQVSAIVPKAGDPGRDAKVAAPVTYKAGEAYRFNDWARHAGGLWHCHRDTIDAPSATADCGWSLVIDGVSDIGIDVDPVDPRAVALMVRLASGVQRTLAFRIPGIVGRGPWEPAVKYETGDSVSHDGSAWLAKHSGIGHKPGDPASVDFWTLHVKRGKNGISQPPLRAFEPRGEYDPNETYEPQNLVRAAGSIWCCVKTTRAPPSPTCKDWMLFLPGAEYAA